MKKEGTEWGPGLEMKLRNKALAEANGNAGTLAGCENPWLSLIWSDTQGKVTVL